jgi:MFS family permease
MNNRWVMLAVLFLARTSMAFQFQAVAALAPFYEQAFQVTLVEIGVLIGLYLAPGVIVAIPGGAVAARFGEKRIVALAMGLMLIGGAMISLAPDWGWVTAGRLVAGAGGVVLNIVMTKMVVDWFAGAEISTAMAIFINSWPIGIALALLSLPWVGSIGGLDLAQGVVLASVALGLALFVLIYRVAPGAQAASPSIRVGRLPLVPLAMAGLIWALYNAALAMVFSFGPAMLIARDWSVTEAGSMTSLFMVVVSVVLPLGGILADRTGRRDLIIAISLLSFVAIMPLALIVPQWAVVFVFVVVGILSPLAAGPIMTLAGHVLPVAVRAFGMGVFFAIYYGVMMIAPPVAGALAEGSGDIGMALVLGAVMSLAALVCLFVYRKTGRDALTTAH